MNESIMDIFVESPPLKQITPNKPNLSTEARRFIQYKHFTWVDGSEACTQRVINHTQSHDEVALCRTLQTFVF